MRAAPARPWRHVERSRGIIAIKMPRHKPSRSLQKKPPLASVIDRPHTLWVVGLALILLATRVVYFPAMKGGVLWDDDAHITKPGLQSVPGLYRIWFEPGATQQYY